jgi:hypothetical protein
VLSIAVKLNSVSMETEQFPLYCIVNLLMTIIQRFAMYTEKCVLFNTDVEIKHLELLASPEL